MLDNLMIRYYFLLILLFIFLFTLISSCAKSSFGKININETSLFDFLKTGKTTKSEVLNIIGEPFGYRENGDRSVMIYLNYRENYFNFLITQFRIEKAYRLSLIFKGKVLQKMLIVKEGLGLDAGIDDQLIQILSK